MPPDKRIGNAQKRSEVYRKEKKERAQAKLKRRMDTRKAERLDPTLKTTRTSKNVPRTLDNTREYDDSSYLTANPAGGLMKNLQGRVKAKKVVKTEEVGSDEEDDEDDEVEEDEDDRGEGSSSGARRVKAQVDEEGDENEDEDEEMLNGDEDASAETSTSDQKPLPPTPSLEPPKILLTTSPHATQITHAFLSELRSVFPGGEVYKRLKGRGFELGRIARWAAKRGFGAMVVVNEDHKKPNALTVINLPAGPTAYFKLTSVVPGSQISGHARPSPHSPELILNNFQTLLGLNVGRLFGSLFPPMPQFRGRQVVTLHNQRDFLFFRRHRYMFASTEKARLQEIGPRFTLKLRWLRKGLPSVLAADGVAPRSGEKAEAEDDDDVEGDDVAGDEEGDVDMDENMERTDKPNAVGEGEEDEDEDDEGQKKVKRRKGEVNGVKIPALDEQQEYEWKWKPKMEVSRRTFFL